MCGRFAEFSTLERLHAFYPIDQVDTVLSPNYNVAPTQDILAITRKNDLNILERLRWGLVPFWAKDRKIGSKMINARVETAASKPAFRSAFKSRRCLIPADGFYEWKGKPGDKLPVFITLPDEKPFAFAGLWEIWDSKEEAEPLQSCTILTTDASPAIRDIHHRMPVILKSDFYRDWLHPETTAPSLDKLLAEMIHTEFSYRPVSRAVNSVKNNSADLIRNSEPGSAV